MSAYHYQFRTVVTFLKPVYNHQFLLRCTPCECEFQHLSENRFSVEEATWLASGRDAFGNALIYGAAMDFHSSFTVISEGDISDRLYLSHDSVQPYYRFPSPLTVPSPSIVSFAHQIDAGSGGESDLQRALALSSALYDRFRYATGTTRSCTTAAEAFAQGCGVCQDYAHVLIAMCREVGISARYVTGFLRGEGLSHAWVEVYDSGAWYGIDPTHNMLIEGGHIKIAHGRDADDCPINRGVYLGMRGEMTNIRVCVTPQ